MLFKEGKDLSDLHDRRIRKGWQASLRPEVKMHEPCLGSVGEGSSKRASMVVA